MSIAAVLKTFETDRARTGESFRAAVNGLRTIDRLGSRAARHAGSDTAAVSETEQTPYDRLGGSPFFVQLVGSFYARLADDPVLRPLYPEADLAPAAERLCLFLVQYWGGPATYSDERGHPRLRLRHAPFAVDDEARRRWLGHMRAALAEQALAPELEALLWDYFEPAAAAMVNTPAAR